VLLGSLTYLLRHVPRRVFNTILRLLSVEVWVNSDVDAFPRVMKHVAKHRVKWLQRTFLVGSERYVDGDSDWMVGPGYGLSLFMFGKIPALARLSKEESDSGKFKMQLHIRFPGRSPGLITSFIDAVKKTVEDDGTESISIWSMESGGYWELAREKKPKRSLPTVFIDPEVKGDIVQQLQWFYDNGAWYKDRGLPWKMGILLYGDPGTGKSSLIHALASDFNKDIRMMNLNILTDSAVLTALANVNEDDFLVIEDIDTYSVVGRRLPGTSGGRVGNFTDRSSIAGLSLSSLLNMLDGIPSPDGAVIIATTNYISKVDSALVRKGRFDLQYELTPVCGEVFVDMWAAFYGEPARHKARKFVDDGNYCPTTGADLQDIMRRMGMDDALKAVSVGLRKVK
jgi:mitochondrial chaperone BCS1